MIGDLLLPLGGGFVIYPSRTPFYLGTGGLIPATAILLRNATPVALRDGSPLLARN